MKTIVLLATCAIGLAGFLYAAIHHSRFIRAGGQRGVVVQERKGMSVAARVEFGRMKIGYGIFCAAIVVSLTIAAVFGPAEMVP